ncbi:2,3,4,5-tetrahydropyridine-2,6-dicarboxylate N-acetyltransferase [Mollicutes bacterium LVI A0039]|nr:2,3,4,5-tetrahydropyridine-2,6-dicarboxylate N-acetyltransferase [Mollicutes bacterium LVI A0039]
MQTAQEIIRHIKEAKKQTVVKCYFNTDEQVVTHPEVKYYNFGGSHLLIGDYSLIQAILAKINPTDVHFDYDHRNSAIKLLNTCEINARIEPGAVIRENVSIGDNAVIMMGALINIGSVIGPGTMIDMGAVLGGRAQIGRNCHIGAGAVIAGVIEPPSASPVTIGDDVLVGANAVVLEGVQVGAGAVIAAGSIVTTDVPAGSVVAGSPARVIKMVDEQTESKTEIIEDLRTI